MTNYYIEKENKIVLFDTNKQKLISTLGFMPQYKGFEIQQTDKEIIERDGGFVFYEDVEVELLQNAKEAKLKEASDKAYAYEQTDALITVKATNAMTKVSGLYHIEGHFTNMIKISAYAQSMGNEDILLWNTKENVNVFLNKTGCLQLSALMQQMNVNLWTVAFPTYLAQIEACTTIDEVNAIEIEYKNPDEVVDLTSELIAYNQPSDII